MIFIKHGIPRSAESMPNNKPMPIHEYRKQISPQCSCCGEITMSTTGILDIGFDPAPTYVARWNPHSVEQGIAVLIGLGDPRGFVAARYDMNSNGVSIIGPDDYDWHSETIRILERSQVIGTPIAGEAFRVIDEIWTHDPEVRAFLNERKDANG